MCILIVKDVDTTISKKVLRQCYTRNPDGCGIAYINEDENGVRRVRTKKNMTFGNFYKRFRVAERENPKSPFIIHFRITTHGGTRIENNHPFKVDSKHVFGHNGIINCMSKELKGNESDTRAFNRLILRNLDEGWMYNKVTKTLIESFIGHSKLAVLNTDYDYTIYNESMGEWKDGIWYSNTSYQPPVYRKAAYTGGYYQPHTTKTKAKGWGQKSGWSSEANKKISEWEKKKAREEEDKKEKKRKETLIEKIDKQKKEGPSYFGKREGDEEYPMKLIDMNKDTGIEETDYVVHRSCACCGTFTSIKEMEYYRLASMDAECYCADCADVMLKNFIVKPEDEISYSSFLECIDDDVYSQGKGGKFTSKTQDEQDWDAYYDGLNEGYCG